MKQIGRYQLQEKLGQGGMGVVYRAFDTLLERVVAVKVISASIDENPELRDRFFREARAAGQLSHPHIITVHDLGEHEGQPYLAMEFLEGEDLQSRMARREPMSLRRKLEIACEICQGLEYAHARGIVHRDIKPANIFLCAGGAAKILDFGLARLVSSELTRSHVMMGTLNYMAPEQIRGDRADHRADIFSVGVVIYELLSGRKAFDGDSFASMMFKILEQTPTPLAEIDPTLPAELVNIVDRAMAKLRDERYQSIGDLARDLTVVRQQLAFLESPASGRIIPAGVRSAPPETAPVPTPGAFDETRLATPVTPLPALGSPPGGLTPPPREAGSDAPTMTAPVPGAQRRSLTALAVIALVAVAVTAAMWFVLNRRPAETPTPAVISAPAPSPDELLGQALASFDSEDFAAAEQAAAAVLQADAGNAAAISLRDRARRARETVTAGLERARTLAAAERFEEASKAAGEVLAVAPRNAEAREIVEDAVTRSRGRGATEARSQAARSEAAARRAGAPTLAARPWAAAVAAGREARRLLESGDPQAATIKYYEATGLFASAETAAEQEAAQRQARARAQTPPAAQAAPPVQPPNQDRSRSSAQTPPAGGTAAAPPSSPPRSDAAPPTEPVPSPPQTVQAPSPPPAAPPPPAPAPSPAPSQPAASTPATGTTTGAPAAGRTPPPPAAEPPAPSPTAAVTAVLQAYREALEARSLPALQRIWPGLRGSELTALRSEFEHASRIEVDLVDPRITIDGTSATVTFLRRYGVVTVDGQRLQTDNRTTMTLTRAGDNWVIESLRFATR